MKPGRYSGHFAAANDETSLFEGYVVFKTYDPGIVPDMEKAPPALLSQSTEVKRDHSRYCDQPMDWRTRLFGFAGTASMVGLVLAAALFAWKVVYQPVLTNSKPLTIVTLAPLAAPPEPVREVVPGPEQVEKQEAEAEPVRQTPPVPLIQRPMAASVKADAQKSAEIVDPGPPVPETTAPKSIAAPAANRFASHSTPNWEGLILAHLERFRRYPARARAARQQGTAYLRFTINRAGMVISATIVKKSGSYDLDQAALDTLTRAQPLPAIPTGRPDVVELTIPVEFNLR